MSKVRKLGTQLDWGVDMEAADVAHLLGRKPPPLKTKK
jgi:hypothetical protein